MPDNGKPYREDLIAEDIRRAKLTQGGTREDMIAQDIAQARGLPAAKPGEEIRTQDTRTAGMGEALATAPLQTSDQYQPQTLIAGPPGLEQLYPNATPPSQGGSVQPLMGQERQQYTPSQAAPTPPPEEAIPGTTSASEQTGAEAAQPSQIRSPTRGLDPIVRDASGRLRYIEDLPPRRGAGGPVRTITESMSLTLPGYVDPEVIAAKERMSDEVRNALKAMAVNQAGGQNEEAKVLGATAAFLADNNEAIRGITDRLYSQQEQRLAYLDRMNEDISARRVDPDHFYSSRGGGARVGSAIAVALSTLGQAFAPGLPNVAMEILNTAIDRDMAAQQANIDNARAGFRDARNLYGDLVNLTNDRIEAEYLFRATQLEEAETRIRGIRARTQSQDTLRKLDLLLAQMEEEKLANQIAAQQQNGAVTISQEVTQRGSAFSAPRFFLEPFGYPEQPSAPEAAAPPPSDRQVNRNASAIRRQARQASGAEAATAGATPGRPSPRGASIPDFNSENYRDYVMDTPPAELIENGVYRTPPLPGQDEVSEYHVLETYDDGSVLVREVQRQLGDDVPADDQAQQAFQTEETRRDLARIGIQIESRALGTINTPETRGSIRRLTLARNAANNIDRLLELLDAGPNLPYGEAAAETEARSTLGSLEILSGYQGIGQISDSERRAISERFPENYNVDFLRRNSSSLRTLRSMILNSAQAYGAADGIGYTSNAESGRQLRREGLTRGGRR